MSIQSATQEDAIFDWHHSVEVLCQIEFPPILALSNYSSIIGFQETLRSDYPNFSESMSAIDLSEDSDAAPQSFPIWRLQDYDGAWRVSLGCNFVAISSSGGHFEEFFSRLLKVLQALERTIAPDRSTWREVRRISYLSPAAHNQRSWHHLIRDELLKPFDPESFNCISEFKSVTLHGKIHIHDGSGGILTIGHGLYDEEAVSYILDLEYETSEVLSMEASDAIVKQLKSYYDSVTKSFQWCIKDGMIHHLEHHSTEGILHNES